MKDPKENFESLVWERDDFDCVAYDTHDKIDGQEDGVKPAFLMQELCQQRVQYGKYALIHINDET